MLTVSRLYTRDELLALTLESVQQREEPMSPEVFVRVVCLPWNRGKSPG